MDLEYQATEAQKEIDLINGRIRTAVHLAMSALEPSSHLLVDKHGNEKASDLRDVLREHIEDAFYEPLQERQDIIRQADAAEDEAYQQGVRQDWLVAQMGSVGA